MTDSTTAGAAVEEGTYGRAQRVPRDLYAATKPACLDVWLVTHPLAHPVWDQYLLMVATFADMNGLEPVDGAGVTHQLILGAIDPVDGHLEPATLGTPAILTPIDIVEQFTATDVQAIELTGLCAQAIVNGLLWPETSTSRKSVTARWHQAVTDTLRHIQTGDCCNDHHHPLQVGP